MVQGPASDRPVRPQLTEEQAVLMRDIIDMYVEGIGDAQQATIEDNSLGDLETLLKVCGGYSETITQLRDIRRQLTRGVT